MAGVNCATSAPPPKPSPVNEPQAEQDVCKLVPCRPAIQFTLNDNAGRQFLTTVPPSPYAGDGIAVYPGDDFFVAADERDGVLGNFRYVPAPANPKDVIHVVSFVQEKRDGRYSMVLTLQSFYSRPLVYHALAHDALAPDHEYFKTTTCPILGQGRVIEIWPQAITFLKLKDLRFGRGDEPCAYY